MTQRAALLKARFLWGKSGAIKIDEHGAHIGKHGEYVPVTAVKGKIGDPKYGRYRCDRCSNTLTIETDLVESLVWHRAGSLQRRYAVGFVALGMFFTIKGEGASFEEAFANAGK